MSLAQATLKAWKNGQPELAWLYYQQDESGICHTKTQFFAEMRKAFPHALQTSA